MKTYYFVSIDEKICSTVDTGSFIDFFSKEIGNYFKSKEDAEKFFEKVSNTFYPLLIYKKVWFITRNGGYKSFEYKDTFSCRFYFCTKNIFRDKETAKKTSIILKNEFYKQRNNGQTI